MKAKDVTGDGDVYTYLIIADILTSSDFGSCTLPALALALWIAVS